MISPPAAATASSSASSSGCGSRPAAITSICGTWPHSRASVSRRRPSARNTPSRLRCFLSRRDAQILDRGIGKAGDRRAGPYRYRERASVLAELAFDQRDQLGQRASASSPATRIFDRCRPSPRPASSGRGSSRQRPRCRPCSTNDVMAFHRAGGGDELGAGAGVQAALVGDDDILADFAHRRSTALRRPDRGIRMQR